MRSIFVSGGTGTFGRAFVPQALASGLFERVIIFSRDEAKQHEQRGLYNHDPRLRWFIGDVRDRDRLILALHGVDVVVHAAALKHVIAGEANPNEFVQTNIIGSQNVARAAMECGVQKVMAISTDKAVDPINLYGATKMCMERLLLASNVYSPGKTAFSCVRYGNVLGSRGSFIETLEKLKADGAKTFPLRHMDSTRFWMKPEQAAQFVMDRLLEMKGGEIFVPKLPSSSALSFARSFLPDAEPEIVGVPRGEKIHEILISADEWQYTEDAGDMYVIRPNGLRNPSKEIQRYSSDGNKHEARDHQNVGRAERRSQEVGQGSPVHYGE